MRTALVVFAVTLALTQAATVEKRESPVSSSGSYGSASAQPSAYGAPNPTNSYSPSQGAIPAASTYVPPPTYSNDPLMAPQAVSAAAGATQGYSTGQGYSSGYNAPPVSYTYADPAGYTMQQGYEGFMVPSMYDSKWFAVVPWIVVGIGGAVLLALGLPLLLSIPGLIFPFLKLGKLFKKKQVVDALLKRSFIDENPQLVDIAHKVFEALGKFGDMADTKEE